MSDTKTNEFKVEPYAPIKTPGRLAALLESCRDRLEPLLPENLDFERFKLNVRNSVIEIPKIMGCTQNSMIQACITACELGLIVGKARGEAYIIPFNNKTDEGFKLEATLIPGYPGLVKLAYGTDAVARIQSAIVHEKDSFSIRRGMDPHIMHEEYVPRSKGDSRGEVIGAYCVIKLNNGEYIFDYLSIDELNKIRASAKSKDSPAYRNWVEEMHKKAAFRRTVKWLNVPYGMLQQSLEHANREFDLDTGSEDADQLEQLNKKLLPARKEKVNKDSGEITDVEPKYDWADEEADSESYNKPPVENEADTPLVENEATEGEEEVLVIGESISTDEDFFMDSMQHFFVTKDEMTFFVKLVLGTAPTSMSVVTSNHRKKLTGILKRINQRFNRSGTDLAFVRSFLAFCFQNNVELSGTKEVDAAAKNYNESLKKKSEPQTAATDSESESPF